MAEESKTYVFQPDGNNAYPWMAMNNGGGLLGNGFIGSLFGGFLGSMFPNLFGGYGMGGVGGGAGAALGAQATANNNTDLIVQAVTSQGEQSRQAVQTLSNMLGQDFNSVNTQVQAISAALAQIATQNAITPLQVINAVNSGNTAITSQLAQCCCENRLLTTQQGYESQIRTLEQTNQLGSQADRNANNIIQAINAQTVAMDNQFCALKERELQNKINSQDEIITQLRNQIAVQNQTAQFAAMIAPLQQQINFIASRQPNTVPVVWPNLTVTETPTATASTTAGA